jgi:hypothetical protein
MANGLRIPHMLSLPLTVKAAITSARIYCPWVRNSHSGVTLSISRVTLRLTEKALAPSTSSLGGHKIGVRSTASSRRGTEFHAKRLGEVRRTLEVNLRCNGPNGKRPIKHQCAYRVTERYCVVYQTLRHSPRLSVSKRINGA